jgi:hypothetical protein
MSFRYLLGALALLPACTAMDVTTPPISVAAKNPAEAVGIDVYARARAQGNPVPRFRGPESVTVRTQGKTSGGSWGEIAGAECLLDGASYAARFHSPAVIVVPDYGPNSPALFVRCTLGERAGTTQAVVYNDTSQQRHAAAYGTGVLGAIIIGAVAAANTNNETDDFKYPPVTVQLK